MQARGTPCPLPRLCFLHPLSSPCQHAHSTDFRDMRGASFLRMQPFTWGERAMIHHAIHATRDAQTRLFPEPAGCARFACRGGHRRTGAGDAVRRHGIVRARKRSPNLWSHRTATSQLRPMLTRYPCSRKCPALLCSPKLFREKSSSSRSRTHATIRIGGRRPWDSPTRLALAPAATKLCRCSPTAGGMARASPPPPWPPAPGARGLPGGLRPF